MSLKRYTTGVDGTIPVAALLYNDEDLLTSQEGVGIYDGMQKSAPHQSGTLYATTHRLFYIDSSRPRSNSFALDLTHVAKTEYYAGLFTSSPKVTLHLYPLQPQLENSTSLPDNKSGPSVGSGTQPFESWECEVCSYRNPPGLSPAASSICGLCGVPRASIKNPVNIVKASSAASSTYHLSSSLPSSSIDLSIIDSSAPTPSQSTPSSAFEANNDEIACQACTFLNHRLLAACEMCGTPLPKQPTPSRVAHHPPAKSAPTSRPPSPPSDAVEGDDDHPDRRIIRLSFRKGGDKAFYAVLRRTLLGKAWEVSGGNVPKPNSQSRGGPATGRSGINGILRNVENTAATAQTGMEDALKDLEALMVKWKDMVRLAQDLNERLTAASDAAASTPSPLETGPVMTTKAVVPEEATFIRSSLAQLGLQMTNVPVTLDMIRDERKWTEELARELAGVLQGGGGRGETGGLMRSRGIVGLDEVWGGWNRARGVALIPPSTFLLVLPHLPRYTNPPVHMRTFPSSGLAVLHIPQYSRHAFASRMVSMIMMSGPQTTVQLAQEEDLPIALVEEMVREVEDDGEICRDEGGAGIELLSRDGVSRGGGEVRWWVNIFRGYVWDGHEE